MVNIGDIAPIFTLKSHQNEEISLSKYIGVKNIVLSFYIYSFTEGWSLQISKFRQNIPEFQEINTQVLSISTDPSPSQKAFSMSLGNISYPLLSDFHPKGKISKLNKVFNYNNGTAKRAIIIINKNGIIKFKKIYLDISELDMEQIFTELSKLKN